MGKTAIYPTIISTALFPPATASAPGAEPVTHFNAVEALPTQKSWIQQLREDAAAWDGGNVAQWDDSLALDFDARSQTTPIVPFGTITNDGSPAPTHDTATSLFMDGTAQHVYWQVQGVLRGAMQALKWWLKFRAKLVDKNVYAAFFLQDLTGNTVYVGVEFGHGAPTAIRAISGTGASPSGSSGGTTLLAYDTNYHTYEIRSDGLSTTTSMQVRVDGGAWVTQTVAMSTGNTAGLTMIAYGSQITLDYCAMMRKTGRT